MTMLLFETLVAHRDHSVTIAQEVFAGKGRLLRTHSAFAINRHQNVRRSVNLVDYAHISENVGVARVINYWTAPYTADLNDPASCLASRVHHL